MNKLNALQTCIWLKIDSKVLQKICSACVFGCSDLRACTQCTHICTHAHTYIHTNNVGCCKCRPCYFVLVRRLVLSWSCQWSGLSYVVVVVVQLLQYSSVSVWTPHGDNLVDLSNCHTGGQCSQILDHNCSTNWNLREAKPNKSRHGCAQGKLGTLFNI